MPNPCGQRWRTQQSKWETGRNYDHNALALGFVGLYARLTVDGLESCREIYHAESRRRTHSTYYIETQTQISNLKRLLQQSQNIRNLMHLLEIPGSLTT